MKEATQLTGEHHSANRFRRRNLRIAIRQLERAELYLVALYSLDVAGEGLENDVDDLVRRLRGLRQHMLRLKATA